MFIKRKFSSSRINKYTVEYDNFFYINYIFDLFMNKKRDLNSVVPFMISSIARRQNEETLDFGIITLEKFLNCDKINKSSKNRKKVYMTE